ncbi:ABC transporter ATP-binding protein [Candidatus Formimonas warabiya]|uniref:Peptide ABC transporter ATP-binding protein n=1 Tax=Formimonas warabiya TaxID=1761012 RepID=A0A3G1KSF9_FORW1|nr:ABC transporter ATP-binding protein [Candidatus Formimonas warabiya]ATW25344.1 peptide ABC transporter ATP-binding protein [Candidatus Formimonas warabiya]
MEKNNLILDIRNLSISFRVYGKITKVIDQISFSVAKGQRVGLVGESGCGKTTTLRAILNVLPSNAIVASGEVFFNGRDVFKMPAAELEQFRRKGAGMIFQDPSSALNPVFTIGDQLKTALKYAGQGKMDKGALYQQVKQALGDVYLADPERIMDSYPFQLSGGMKQRVCIAVTLAAGRELLLADEPGTSLDVTIQDQILRLINQLVLDRHLSVIMVSHSLGVIREVTSFVNIMYAGTIVESGDTGMVFRQPKHPYTVALMNCVPKLTGEGIAEGVPGRIPDYAHPPLGCRFSPRCPYAQEICHQERPPRSEVGPNHWVSCYFANEVM